VWIIISEKTGSAGKKKAKSFVKLSRCAGVSKASADRESGSPACAGVAHAGVRVRRRNPESGQGSEVASLVAAWRSKKASAVHLRPKMERTKWSAQGWSTQKPRSKKEVFFPLGGEMFSRFRCRTSDHGTQPRLPARRKVCAAIEVHRQALNIQHAHPRFMFCGNTNASITPGLQQKLADRKCSSASHLFAR
jgi:hypothetical protein